VYFLEVVCDESGCLGVVQLDTAGQAALGELAKLRDDKLVEFAGTELHCGRGWQRVPGLAGEQSMELMIVTPCSCLACRAWMRGWPIRALDNVAPNGHPPCDTGGQPHVTPAKTPSPFSPSALGSDQIASQVPPLPPCHPAPCLKPAMLAQSSTLPFVHECTASTLQVRISGQTAPWLPRNNACNQRHPRCLPTRPAPSRQRSGYGRHIQMPIELHPGTRQTSTDEPMR
jgi:hypothetical protein